MNFFWILCSILESSKELSNFNLIVLSNDHLWLLLWLNKRKKQTMKNIVWIFCMGQLYCQNIIFNVAYLSVNRCGPSDQRVSWRSVTLFSRRDQNQNKMHCWNNQQKIGSLFFLLKCNGHCFGYCSVITISFLLLCMELASIMGGPMW
jgi:hypothetical protein